MSETAAGNAAPPARWAPLQFLAAIALLWYLPRAGWALLGSLDVPPAGSSQLDGAAWTMVVFGAVCVCIVAFALLTPRVLPWRPLRAIAVLRVYLPCALVWLAVTVGYLYTRHALGHAVAKQPFLESAVAVGRGDPRIVPFVLTTVVLAPLAEEIVFRGYLLGALQLVVARWPALVMTSIAFGLVHGLDYALPIALLGLVFGWLRQRHGSLWPSVFAHMLHNAVTMAVALWAPVVFTWMYPS